MQLTSILPPRSSPETTGSLFLRPHQTEITSRHDSAASTKPKRLNICAFQPLPPIIASPMGSPVPSDQPFFSSFDPVLFPSSPPTWIATPPTPPSKTIRRSNTNATRRNLQPQVAPSASFPASMHTHAQNTPRTVRHSISVPELSFKCSEHSDSFSSMMASHFLYLSPDTHDPFDGAFSISGPLMTRREHAGSYIIKPSATDGGYDDKADEYSPPESTSTHTGSWSDHSVEDARVEKSKDTLRKFHALKELLATEAGYLLDLKALITIYLRNLPILAVRPLTSSNTFGRAQTSFASGPWIHSYTQLQASAMSSTSTLPETPTSPPSAAPSIKDPPKTNSRYLFSDNELESLTRNAEEILEFHELFVRELSELLEPLGFTMGTDEKGQGDDHLENLGQAIRAVSAKFATEASRFKAYQTFCAGHAEAMDILRRAYQQFPVELDAFENRCNTMVSEMLNRSPSEPLSSSRSSTGSPTTQVHLSVEDRKRAMSLTSLDGAVRSLRPRSSMVLAKDSMAFTLEPRRERPSPRIAFADYMIKPIQRICRYPLLLDQLLPSKGIRALSQKNSHDVHSDVDVVVESAAQAMRHVAAAVDEARHRQDVATQSALIFTRICLSTNSTTTSPFAQPLTPEFLASLGDCLLAGSMDVIHYHPYMASGQASSIKVKYLGAFLYPGGYLILVKVSKGKKYEPRHWFSLADFEVSDVDDEGAMLPCSFKLSSGEVYFELAAACQREKDAWLSSIHEALKHTASWTNEPTPSYKFDGKGELLPDSDDGNAESPKGLTTIRSIPEGGNVSDMESTEPFFASLRTSGKAKRKRPRYETPAALKQDTTLASSRRSSSTSVKAIFSASDNATVVIRRSSHAARVQVDQELQDVISQSCLTARSYACSHELELFQAPKTTRSGYTRSNSAISMAGMSRLSKHESVRVPRRRATEGAAEILAAGRGASPLTSGISGKRSANKLVLSLASPEECSSMAQFQDGIHPPPLPSPPAFTEMMQPRNRVSSLRGDSVRPPSRPVSPNPAGGDVPAQKPRSFVRNIRGLFNFRPTPPPSPTNPGPLLVTNPNRSAPQQSENHLTPFTAIHRWTTLRRRPRSVHDEPGTIEDLFDDPEKQRFTMPATPSTPLST